MAAQVRREEALAIGARGRVVHRVETGPPPRGGIALDDEGAAIRRVAIVVRHERAVLALAERERQAIEALARAVPDELVGEPFRARLERRRVRSANQRIHAVGADDEIAIAELGE